jgi:hypothetical protein
MLTKHYSSLLELLTLYGSNIIRNVDFMSEFYTEHNHFIMNATSSVHDTGSHRCQVTRSFVNESMKKVLFGFAS